MTKLKIAIQGELGAYSHIAANDLFSGTEIKTCTTFEETFKQAYEDENCKIIIPIENSLAGRVADIHHLIPESGLFIVGEHFQRVNHQLLELKTSKLEDLKYIKSHAQGLAQCRKFINKQVQIPI